MIQADRLDIALVGRQLVDNENLGLGYLLAAAHRAQLRAERLVLNSWADLNRVAGEILRQAPTVVGLAMPDGGSAALPLSLGELLRALGYRGHITAGGPFATLARHWLLDRYPWLDSVVRHAGEVPLTELTRGLSGPAPRLTTVPGLTTRQGDGRPAPVLDPSQLELTPEHGELPTVLGHPMVHILATRGCRGRCAYCGPAALQRLERDEGERAGHDRATLTCAGVGGQRRRTLDNLCDEMATLWHDQQVRYFYFVDEHLLPRREPAALEWLDRWRQGLAERHVGPLGIGCMLRADWVTPAALEAFAAMGLVRTFLGVELGSDDEHRAFARGGQLRRGLAVLDQLAHLGVAASCNLMLVHPHSTRDSLAAGIETLRRFGAHGVEATQMQIYYGTKLHEQMALQQRVTGNPLQYGYRFADSAVERFAATFSRLRFDAFGDYSLTCRQHDAALAISLARRLHPKTDVGDLATRLEDQSRTSNELRIDSYATALAMATGRSEMAASALVDQARRQAASIANGLTAVYDEVLRRVARPAPSFAPMRAAAVNLLGVCLASASLAACQSPDPAAPPPATVDGPPAPTAGPPPTPVDDPAPVARASGGATAVPVLTSAPAAPPGCDEAKQEELRKKVATITTRIDTCATRTVLFGWGFKDGPISVRSKDGSEQRNRANDERIKRALEQELTPAERECLVQQSVFVPLPTGEQGKQHDRLLDKIDKTCTRGRHGPAVLVEVDDQGVVVDVRAGDPSARLSPTIQACVRRALKGLRFPCLAGEEITRYDPHPVIME